MSDVRFVEGSMAVNLMDGRCLSVPLEWYPRLAAAGDESLANWRISSGGYGIHWPDIDEDLSVAGLLRGAPAIKARTRQLR
ncbi:MAG: DUF2442 domain-containing protein [Pontixanthobacter sp.]